MKYCFLLLLLSSHFVQAQNVGIGTTTPNHKLDVNGTLRSTGNAFFNDKVVVGGASPVPYKFVVTDGEMGVYSTAANKYWYFDYYNGYNQFALYEGSNGSATIRLSVNNGGNVGIGTYQPSAKLHVNGDVKVSTGEIILSNGVSNSSEDKAFVQMSGDNLRVGTYSSNTNGKFIVRVGGGDQVTVNGDGDLSAQGEMTVKGNKGVLYNASGAANMRYYTRQASFSVNNLQPQTLSGETSIAFDGGFSLPPVVTVGDIVSNGGTAGQLFALDLKVYDVTANTCKVRLMNTGNAPITQNITWNIVCIGR